MIASLLLFVACAPGELKEGFEPEGPASVDDVTQVTITPDKPTLGTDEMVRIRVRGQTDNGEELTPPMDWTADGGTITQTSNNEIYFSSTRSDTVRVIGKGRNKNKPADTTTVVVVEPTYPIVSIAVSPDPASVSAGSSQTFVASGLRSDGSSVSPAVSWGGTGGAITSGGVYTAGADSGNYIVTALTTDGLTDAAAVTVNPAPLQGPNEPDGFTRIFETAFSSLPGTAGGTLAGKWSGLYREGDVNMTLSSDGSSIRSASGNLRTKWPAGLASGVAPGAWWFWDNSPWDASTAYRQIYLSVWMKIPTANFENQAVYTKLFYFAHGNTYQKNEEVIALRGNGSTSLMSAMEIVFSHSQADDRTGDGSGMPRYQNVNTSVKFTAGSWHRVEIYANVGTVDNYDGIAKVWIDGTLVTSYTNLKFLDSRYEFTKGFYEGSWDPVWGGKGGTKTRDDFLDMDHMYVSGKL
jgi:hypothetical protein